MKNILLIIILIIWLSYYFISHDTQVILLEKVWINSSFLPVEEIVEIKNEWWVVNLEFDTIYKVTYKWDISSWKIMEDLSWSSLQFVKCFYPDQYNNFNGNVVLHRILLWKNKTANVKLIQDNPESNLTIYVYKTDALSKVFPPEKNYVYDCKINILKDITKEIKIKGNTVTSDIVVWVSWANWLTSGGYTLEIEEK